MNVPDPLLCLFYSQAGLHKLLLCFSHQRPLPAALDTGTPQSLTLIQRGEGGQMWFPTSSSRILQQTNDHAAERQGHRNVQLQLLQRRLSPRDLHLCLCQRLDLWHSLTASGQQQRLAGRERKWCLWHNCVVSCRGRRVITWEVLVNDCYFPLRLLFPPERHGTIYHQIWWMRLHWAGKKAKLKQSRSTPGRYVCVLYTIILGHCLWNACLFVLLIFEPAWKFICHCASV